MPTVKDDSRFAERLLLFLETSNILQTEYSLCSARSNRHRAILSTRLDSFSNCLQPFIYFVCFVFCSKSIWSVRLYRRNTSEAVLAFKSAGCIPQLLCPLFALKNRNMPRTVSKTIQYIPDFPSSSTRRHADYLDLQGKTMTKNGKRRRRDR